MVTTYPLRLDLIQRAIDDLSEARASATAESDRRMAEATACSRVAGPYMKYFISSYACAMGERGETFVGDFRVHSVMPQSHWQPLSLSGGTCLEIHRSAEGAMAAAERLARLNIDEIPQPETELC